MKMKRNLLLAVVIGGLALVAVAGTAEAINLESWDKQIDNPSRFKVLNDFGGAAVLDKETQLVWEQSPDTGPRDWLDALGHCYRREVGNRLGLGSRKGWRLPTIEELASLIDATVSSPSLPSGHPFSNVQLSGTWSATTNAGDTSFAWGVGFTFGGVSGLFEKMNTNQAWCVRAGQGIDGVQ